MQRHERAWHAQEQQAGWLVSTKQEEEDREEGVSPGKDVVLHSKCKGKSRMALPGAEEEEMGR